MGLTKALAEDFAWVVKCARSNAIAGYGLGELFRGNLTVRDLMEISNHRMRPLIECAARIGFLQAASDRDEMERAISEFGDKALKLGYASAN